ncbi:MAG: glycoside hydrolase family 28 protein [Acholeplasmatales bacterium]|nr:glycoside hydrolase family 28 protein [Acholeplasmatales bacterium]
MKFDIIYVSTHSLTLELDNNLPYNTDKEYSVYVNDELYKSGINTNVTSVFNLKSDTSYKISVVQGEERFDKNVKTNHEYVTLNVKRFGAVGDGIHDDTNFIQATINACPKDGRVYIPQGIYHVRPLFLKSHITIELALGAKLLGDTDRKNYPILPGMIATTDEQDEYNLGSWEGNPLDCFASIITGIEVEDVNIIGEGVIDGNASNSDWWIDVRDKKIAWRPRGMFIVRSKNINVQGITVCNTPSWNLHPYFCTNVRFINMNVENPKISPNTDGCDPESCKNVDIIGVNFSVGDDCIAVKSGKIYMGKKYKTPSEKFNIRNCAMNFGHGAIVLGSEMAGGIKDFVISKCLFNQTDRGLRIKTRRGRGKDAIIDGITFDNIKMNKVLTPLVINMFYYCDPDGKSEYVWSKNSLPVDDRTPYLGRFVFKNMVCENVNVAAGTFYGLPEMPIESIELENIKFTYDPEAKEGVAAMMTGCEPMKNRGFIFYNVKHVNMKNVDMPDFVKDDIEKTNVSDFKRC